MNSDNNPDNLEELFIYISTEIDGMSHCYCIFPHNYYDLLNGKDFDTLRGHPNFIKLCERIKALIVTKQKES